MTAPTTPAESFERKELLKRHQAISDRMLGLPTMFDSDELKVMDAVDAMIRALAPDRTAAKGE